MSNKLYLIPLVGLLLIAFFFSNIDVSGGSGGTDTSQVLVSANDTTPGYLNGKLVAGSNITLTENNDGGNETLTIASTASGGGTDTNCSTSPDCNNLYIQTNPLTDQNINIHDLNINGGALNLTPNNHANTGIELINQDGSIDFKVDGNGNIRTDGNILFQDVNSNIGNAGIPAGQIFAYNFRGVPTTNGASLTIPGQTYAFCVFGTNCSGLFFASAAPRGFKFRIDASERWIFGAGATGVDGALWQILRTANPSGTGTQIEGWTFLKDIGIIDYNAQPYTYRAGIWQHLNAREYFGTPNDANDGSGKLFFDQNSVGDKNFYGVFYQDGNVITPSLPAATAAATETIAIEPGTNLLVRKSSSSQYKNTIIDFNQVINPLEILNLRPRTWLDNRTGERGYGYIAEEVIQHYPNLGIYRDGNLDSIQYDAIYTLYGYQLIELTKWAIQKDNQIQDMNTKLNQAEAFITAYCTTGGHQNTPECQAV